VKIRLSKKLVAVVGGVFVLCAGSGAAAVFVGKEKFFGPSYADFNGLTCSVLETFTTKREGRTWVRRYVNADEMPAADGSGDGMARIRTALRVAKSIQEKEKADIVQVAMVSKAGPKDRAEMRGRMIGAQVVYIPDLAKAPAGAAREIYSAFYVDGAATSKGEYYGQRIDMPLADIQHLEAKLNDKTDCIDPVAIAAAEAAAAAGHGATKGHDKKPAKGHEPAGHGEASSGHDAPAAHGEAPAGEHGAAPADGHGEADASAHGEGGEAAAKESGGFLSSVTGLIFGAKEEAAPVAAEHAPEGEGHAAPQGGAHAVDAKQDGHAPAPAGEAHGTAEGSGEHAAKGEAAAPPEAEAAKTEEKSFVSSMKEMIFGSGDTAPDATHDEASVEPAPPKTEPEPAPEPRTSAEGGKRWSKQDGSDEIRSGGPSAANALHDDKAAEPVTAQASDQAGGSNAADAAGAAWLEKLRAQQAGSASKP
jgi:hypothetical protein